MPAVRPGSNRAPDRLHAIDWLRVLTVLAVFFFHIAHIFDFDLEGSMQERRDIARRERLHVLRDAVLDAAAFSAGRSEQLVLAAQPAGQDLPSRARAAIAGFRCSSGRWS